MANFLAYGESSGDKYWDDFQPFRIPIVDKPRLLDIVLILRDGLSTCLDSFLSSTDNDSLVLILARKLIDELDYSPFRDYADLRVLEKRLSDILAVTLPIHKSLEEAKKFLLLIAFHEDHGSFFSLYDTFSVQSGLCDFCSTHFTTTYVLDDFYDGYILVNKIWDCDETGHVFLRWKINLTVNQLKGVLRGEESYNLEGRRLMLSGDIETNPGPEPRIQDLEKQIQELRERLKRLDSKSWRDQERSKSRRKRERRDRNAQGLMSFCKNTGEAMNVMANGMGPVLDSIKTAMDSISKTGEGMKKAFQVPEDVDMVGSLISVVQLVDSILKKNLFSCSLICAQLARQCSVSLGAIMSLVPRLSEDKNLEFVEEGKEPTRVKESLFDCPKILEDKYPLIAIGTTIVGIISLFCKGKCPPIKDMMSHLGIIGRAAQGVRAVRDFLGWIWDYAMSVYCSAFYGITYEEYKLTKEFPELARLSAGIKVTEQIPSNMIGVSSEICKQIIAMKSKLDEYVLDAAKCKSKNLNFITKLRDSLKEKYDAAVASPAMANSIREEPVCVYLYGQPGVGKSIMTTVIIADYFKKYLKEKGVDFNSVCHSRKALNEHWDGFCNQPICLIDEFGNKIDCMVNPNLEFEELQYMINTSEYPLWFAELAKKGVVFFDSELVLLTSNKRYPEIVHLSDPSSIYRRIHIWAEVICKPEFGTPTGRDKHGNIYYQFNRHVAAAHKKVPVEELPALMTEQYIIKLYKVTMDKQAGAVEVLDLNKTLSYEEFFEYFSKVKEERSKDNRDLSDAIRKRAGIDVTPDRVTEKKILDQFKDIFSPEILIEESAKLLSTRFEISSKVSVSSSVIEEDKTKEAPVDDEQEKTEASVAKDETVGESAPKKSSVEMNPNFPVLTAKEKEQFDLQFGDVTEMMYCDADDLDTDLIDISTPTPIFGAWKIKLNNLYTYSKDKFTRTIQYIYKTVSSGLRHTFGKMIGVGGAILSYLGSALNKTASFLMPARTLDKILVVAIGFLIGYLGSKFLLDVPSACEFSLHLNEIYSPCKRCDVCQVMQYDGDSGHFDHFLRRIGVPQVKAALMRCQIWTDDYLSKILLRAEERVRVAERVYSSQPAIPKPRAYAQGLLGCAMPNAIHHVSKVGMNYAEAMRLIGSLCWVNCTFCSSHKEKKYDPMSSDSCIRLGQEIYDSFTGAIESPQALPLPLLQGAKRVSEGDLVRVEQCTNILTKNSVWVQAVTKDGTSSKSTGTFVVGRTFVTTAHSVINSEFEFETIKIQNPNSRETLDIPYKDCFFTRIKQADGKPTDLVLVTVKPVIPSRPMITNKFIRAQDLDLLQEGDIILSGYRLLDNKLVLNEQQTKRFSISTKPTSYNEHPNGTCPRGNPCRCPIYIGNHIDYEIDTYPGCCGSLISAKNKNIPSKIIGFHVAGLTGSPALGVILTRELLESALEAHIKEHSLPDTYMINGRFPYSQS